MIKSFVSSVARLSLVPAKLTVSVAGSLLNELRGNGTVDVPAAPPPRQSTRRATPKPRKAKPKRASRPKPPGDAAIARKVESAIFGEGDVDKGKIVVNVAAGVAQLRGEVESASLIELLEGRAEQVSDVLRVENLLHVPEEPAPGRTEEPTNGAAEATPAAVEPGDRSKDPSPHHALNNPVGEPDPTEWPDPYERREDPRDPDADHGSGAEPHSPTGATSTSQPHPSQDPEAEPTEVPERDVIDR
jgi:hypothetical protein